MIIIFVELNLQQQIQQITQNNTQLMDIFPGAQSDWTTILQMLKSDDEMLVYQGAMELRDALSYAQENQMHGFATEQYMDILVKIVQRDPITDLSNEVKFFCIQCLTTLMDIFPSIVNALVNAGLAKSLTSVMESAVGFIDLTESCIKAFEKIAVENPLAVLRSGAAGIVLQQMDFFEVGTQIRIFKILQRIAKHSNTEKDFDTYIAPLLPFLTMSLTDSSDQKKLEDISRIVFEIQESFYLFFSPYTQFANIGQQYDKLLDSGIFDIIMQHMRQYSDTVAMQQQQTTAMIIDNEIDSRAQNQSLTHQTMLNLFKILENACRFSSKTCNKLFGSSTLIYDLKAFLPIDQQSKSYNQEEFPLVNEAISLLNSIIADRQEEESKANEREKLRRESELNKRQFQLEPSNRLRLVNLAEYLLPRVLFVFETSISSQFRMRTLEVIYKLISLFDQDLLKNFIQPKQLSNFVYQILHSRHGASISVALKVLKKVLDCSPVTYAVPCIREGVSQLISDISTEQKFKRYLRIPDSTDISDKSFDMDIQEVKAQLQHTRAFNPDDHATRDFFERKLLELVERQKLASAEQKVWKEDEEIDSKKPNSAQKIIGLAQALLADYFENSKFLDDLSAHSPQTKLQLKLLQELTQLAKDITIEATSLQTTAQELATVRSLLARVGELLTLEDCPITSYEFRQSNLLWALQLLLTKSPSQAKVALERRRARDSGEEMKRSEEIGLQEAQRQSKQLSKKESRCIMLRLKHVAHVLLRKRNQEGVSPLRALIELSHKVISENDSTLTGGGSTFGRDMGASQSAYGDYDHCISALRQLQRRVTVSLIYDAKRESKQPGPEVQEPSGDEEQQLDFPDLEDSQMEDQSPETSGKHRGAAPLEPKPLKKKGQSHHPAILNLAASPNKEGASSAIAQQKLNSSKVFLKRHHLYRELGQIPVTVEQSSCLQVLEDFLRNRVKTIDHVRSLKFDFGFGGFGGGGPAGSSTSAPGGLLFGGALQGQYQSITQKILRKSLGNAARKLLDSANARLAKILCAGVPVRIKAKSKALASPGGEATHEMEGVEAAEKSGSEEDSHSEGYGDMDEDEEDEEEMAAEIERQRLLDIFVEELPEEILSSSVPEDQQHVLVKLLTKQHAFMIDQLKANFEGAAREDADLTDIAAARQEEMYRLEERLEDFQETMERVQTRFVDKLAERGDRAKPKGEEAKQSSDLISKPGDASLLDHSDEDQEMVDQSEDFQADDFIKEGKMTLLPHQASLKLITEPHDAEMLKPADLSGSEVGSPKAGVEQPADKSDNVASKSVKRKELEAKKQSLEQLLEREFAAQDRRIEQALARERELQEKLRGVQQTLAERGAVEQNEVSEQTAEVLAQDLEELIKQQGEDIDFEFFYNGKPIQANQTMFEIVKDSEARLRQAERATHRAEQVRALQAQEEELKLKARRLAESKGAKSSAELTQLKREADKLRERLHQVAGQLGGGLKGGPPGFLAGLNAHKIYFRIKDKTDEVADLKRQRLDSLAELTNSALRRSRTKSEAVKDISSGSINQFVQQLLDKEFQVFDEEESLGEQRTFATAAELKPTLAKIDEEMVEEPGLENSTGPSLREVPHQPSRKQAENQELEQLCSALKILKVLNFLCAHQDLISEKGIRFIMKSSSLCGEDGSTEIPHAGSPSKHGEAVSQIEAPGFSDLDLAAGFAEIQQSVFQHHKLDSYLQRSIKDPFNLVQGAISPRMQQIFQNCPFLFPFSTKQLYFKLVSFISSIDAHRSIYFLRQYLKQSGAQKLLSHEKDNLKKIAKQKEVIQRDKLVQSAFALIQRIDKRSFLEFEFQGEEGVGLGPTLEFYDNIAEEFKKWSVTTADGRSVSMWRQSADNLLFPHPVCLKELPTETVKQIYEIFRLCGTIVAKAIVDDRQIDLPISPLFWRLCIGDQLSIFDMQKLDRTVFSTLAEFQIVANKAAEIDKQCQAKKLSEEVKNRQLQSLTIANGSRVEDYALTFTLPCYDEIELVVGGREREVCLENAQDYVDLVLHFTFHETVKLQMQAFKKGFNAIFPIASLAPFTHSSSQEGELETMVCGIKCHDAEWLNRDELMQHIQPDHGFQRSSDQYQHFIRYITELEPIRRSEFLKFLTGSKRLPLGGFKNLSPHLTLVLKKESPGQAPDSILPSVMACQNYVKCPKYSSYNVFKAKFDYAVREGQQNFSLS